jgi:hypothetical protein
MGHIGLNSLTPKYGTFANYIANVNNSVSGGDPTLTSLDALLTMRRAMGLIPVFPVPNGADPKPNFGVAGNLMERPEIDAVFADATKIFGEDLPNRNFSNWYGANYTELATSHQFLYYSEHLALTDVLADGGDFYLAIYYNNVGDIRSRTIPNVYLWKTEPDMQLLLEGEIAANIGDVVEIPISIENYAQLGAISLGLNYNNRLIEVLGTSFNEELVSISNEEGQLRMMWYDVNGANYSHGDIIATVSVRILSDIAAGTELFELDAYTELANRDAEIVYNNLKTVALRTDKVGSALTASNYPNPFTNQTTISYNLPEAGNVQVVIYNKFGQIVNTLVSARQEAGVHTINFTDDLRPGVYHYRITLQGETADYTVTKSMIVVK